MFLRLQGSQQEVVEFHDKVFFSKFQENFRTVAGHFKVSKRGKSLRFCVPQISHKHPKGATTTTKVTLHKKP